MPKTISFPNRACPKCGKPIHVRKKHHEACGWSENGEASNSAAPTKRKKRRKRRAAATAGAATSNAGEITVQDIEAVKSVVDRLGSEKVLQLAKVLGK